MGVPELEDGLACDAKGCGFETHRSPHSFKRKCAMFSNLKEYVKDYIADVSFHIHGYWHVYLVAAVVAAFIIL